MTYFQFIPDDAALVCIALDYLPVMDGLPYFRLCVFVAPARSRCPGTTNSTVMYKVIS